MTWLFVSSSLFSILCFSEVLSGKSFYFSTFVLSDQFSCLYSVFVATVAPHYCVHPHDAAGREMITATASGAEAVGLWVLHAQGMGSRVGWRSGPQTASEFSTLACSWPELRRLTSPICTCGKRHFCLAPGVLVHLIKVTEYVCTGKQARQRLHRAMHCMRISVPLSALQCVWVHIKFIPVSTSWAALEHVLKVLLQASQMDRRWIWPGVLSLWYCCTTAELKARD